jgi:ribonucleoside-triphosphate reductase (thioredoxin)
VVGCEIALRPYQFCNLCEINVSDIISQDDLNTRASVAAFFGTLQAGFTDFHYLRPIWKKTTEKDALVGVGMTGIASGEILKYSLKEAAKVVKEVNEAISGVIGINKAARTTTIKPSGTSSCVLGTSSGIHAWHNDYYIRRMRILKDDPLYKYLLNVVPGLLEDDKLLYNTAVLSIPQKAPEGSILRSETALNLLERVKKFNLEWVKAGHRKGDNTNNVSATISINDKREYALTDEDNIGEWQAVGEWMWDNKDTFNGLSVLPADNGSYIQAPFENCTKEKYEELLALVKDIDLTRVIEEHDDTNFSQEIACAGGSCEIGGQ